MKQAITILCALLLFNICKAQDVVGLIYPVDPAQQAHPDIPKGEVLKFDFNTSAIYPGTKRSYWVYIPAEYKPDKPACLYVDMDGVQFNAPTVFDYLISKGEMPVTIGVFVSSGSVMKNDTDAIRYNRSHEFDSMNNDFVNFLITELLSDVEKKKSSDGRVINISKDANDHAIAGASSGAICAFTAAWQRPDMFSRVYSAIGTYVGMRGGNDYPVLIRKTEPKPIRIFLQDGLNDAWNPLFSNWYTSNLNMEAALSFAGYEVNHAWGNGGHDGVQATAIFPDAMRWLWKGWPQKVLGGKSNNDMLPTILPEGEIWQRFDEQEDHAISISNGPGGELFVLGNPGWIEKIDKNGKVIEVIKHGVEAMASDLNGKLDFIGEGGAGLFTLSPSSKPYVVSKNIHGDHLVVADNGYIYVSQPSTNTNSSGKIWLIKPGAKPIAVDSGLRFASAITISPDRSMLLVAEDNTNWIYNYVINADGSLKFKERWYWLHQTDNFGYSQVGSIEMDNQGNLYAATNLGVQVCDQNGRVRAILQIPGGPVTGLCFGGANFDTLYVICNGKLYKRKLKVNGVPAWAEPVHPKETGAG
ncbi:SMP-30/gluconolactonase/LRE family protein [uncultured Mucilaginibacter sp.]|uniref:SMP-30/gluconolactonase/LRE family protein n=1 Tax=uncultured Mucilaginibacter sp. TaxID=797541 RepID=UPI0025ECBB30|nr:SMP-30/gluconolactonase/LRE family protein [uncultured Mucilaginibacter sp.]